MSLVGVAEGGLLLDHATGVVIGATAQVGARTTIYHQVRENVTEEVDEKYDGRYRGSEE